jgi:hypothetical protein
VQPHAAACPVVPDPRLLSYVNRLYFLLNVAFFAIVFSESLASQGLQKNYLRRNVLFVVHTVAIVSTTVAPWDVLPEDAGNDYHLL